MAASWGLAFQYGKKAYEDMWREQEENERLAATRKLYEMEVAAKEAELATQELENAETRRNRALIASALPQLRAGGNQAKQATAALLSQMSGQPHVVKDGKIYLQEPDGSLSESVIKNVNSMNTDQLIGELDKWTMNTRTRGENVREAAKTEEQYQHQINLATLNNNAAADRLSAQLANAWGIAKLQADTSAANAALKYTAGGGMDSSDILAMERFATSKEFQGKKDALIGQSIFNGLVPTNVDGTWTLVDPVNPENSRPMNRNEYDAYINADAKFTNNVFNGAQYGVTPGAVLNNFMFGAGGFIDEARNRAANASAQALMLEAMRAGTKAPVGVILPTTTPGVSQRYTSSDSSQRELLSPLAAGADILKYDASKVYGYK